MADFGGVDLDAFRAEAREWLEANVPSSIRGDADAGMRFQGGEKPQGDHLLWRQRMGEKGWGVPTWPAAYGGGGLSSAQARVINQEVERIGTYNPIFGMGVSMFGPTLLEYGTEAQKQRHIQETRGHLLRAYRHASAGRRSSTHPPDRWLLTVLRNLLHRRSRRQGRHGWPAQRRLDGRQAPAAA
jgi:hypothetical protein